jgi:hypothetical protein
LGHFYARLAFQEQFSISDATWTEMFAQRWFPFAYLNTGLLRTILSRAVERLLIDDLLDDIEKQVITVIQTRIDTWRTQPILGSHAVVLEKAFAHLQSHDYLSASAMIYPRVEGVMRTLHSAIDSRQPSQVNLAMSAAGRGRYRLRDESLLLPQRFEQYLREVYFANFKPGTMSDVVSRHTVSHGVVSVESLDRKAAVVGFLTVLQVSATADMYSASSK